MRNVFNPFIIFAAVATVLPPTASAQALVEGPVVAEVVRVVDGDTLLVLARPWPQQTIEVYVRLRGIDTPELRSRCALGREKAENARQVLEQLAASSPEVQLTKIAADKYFGRIIADVALADGRNPAKEMMAAGLAGPYSGRGQKFDPCRTD